MAKIPTREEIVRQVHSEYGAFDGLEKLENEIVNNRFLVVQLQSENAELKEMLVEAEKLLRQADEFVADWGLDGQTLAESVALFLASQKKLEEGHIHYQGNTSWCKICNPYQKKGEKK